MLTKQLANQRAVADVTLHKHMARVALQTSQVFQIARVCELVQIEHRLVINTQPVQNEICADEAGAACNQNHDNDLFREW